MSEEKLDYIIECEEVTKVFLSEDLKVMALQGLDLYVKRGEILAIMGKSGSGKSTLLNMLGGLDVPTTGKLTINGKDIATFKDKELVRYRNEIVGFVWQKSSRNLLPYLTVVENVESVAFFKHMSEKKRRTRALELLDSVGLKSHAKKYPSELSGGEQQRVAIALSLINDPKILLADEPTGAVDTKTSDEIFDVFKELNRKTGITIIIVTHDIRLANKADRVIMISDGKISTERKQAEEERSVLDKANRLKLSDEVLKEAGIDSDRVSVRVVDGKVVIENK